MTLYFLYKAKSYHLPAELWKTDFRGQSFLHLGTLTSFPVAMFIILEFKHFMTVGSSKSDTLGSKSVSLCGFLENTVIGKASFWDLSSSVYLHYWVGPDITNRDVIVPRKPDLGQKCVAHLIDAVMLKVRWLHLIIWQLQNCNGASPKGGFISTIAKTLEDSTQLK